MQLLMGWKSSTTLNCVLWWRDRPSLSYAAQRQRTGAPSPSRHHSKLDPKPRGHEGRHPEPNPRSPRASGDSGDISCTKVAARFVAPLGDQHHSRLLSQVVKLDQQLDNIRQQSSLLPTMQSSTYSSQYGTAQSRPQGGSSFSSLVAQANSLSNVDHDPELPQIRFGIDEIERMSEVAASRGKRSKALQGEG